MMVSVLISNAVDDWFDSRWGHIKDYTIGICCLFTNHEAFKIN